MPRRMRVPSWVSDSEPVVKKQVQPLRYRIDPSAKKLDILDDLEAELEQENRRGMDPELYFELLDKIHADRAAVIKRRDKGKPIPHCDYMPPSAPRRSPVASLRLRYRTIKGEVSRHVWVLLEARIALLFLARLVKDKIFTK